MDSFWWGVLTPFIAIGGLALAIGAGYLLVAAARHLWGKTHYTLMGKTVLRKNLAVYKPFGDDGTEEEKPKYLDAANTFRDALLKSPTVYTTAALGWRLLLVRDVREKRDS